MMMRIKNEQKRLISRFFTNSELVHTRASYTRHSWKTLTFLWKRFGVQIKGPVSISCGVSCNGTVLCQFYSYIYIYTCIHTRTVLYDSFRHLSKFLNNFSQQ
ncbi:hypothetical protein AOLI_G00155840 [Acnodon oligacanthus]